MNTKQRNFFRVVLSSSSALNFNNFANVSNSWYQVRLPGIMDDPFKKWQWMIDLWYLTAGTGAITSGYSINIPTFPQFDSYSSLTQSVNNCDVLIRSGNYFNKLLTFSGLGNKFNNTSTLENGMINVQINDMLGNNLTSWNNNGTQYFIMIVIFEAPTIKLLH